MNTTTKTKVCYSEPNAKGEVKQYITSETAWEKLLKEATEEQAKDSNVVIPTLVSKGTFAYQFPTTVDEAVALAGGSVNTPGDYANLDTFLQVFSYAASLRQDNEANDILQSENFEAFEGSKDVSYAVAQKQERAKMTPEERALRDLNKGGYAVTADQLRAALDLIKQQSTAAAA
jgi:hypothetical protein